MKVGIFLRIPLPKAGGGYTFASEIFQSLVQLGAGSRHTFVLYSYDKEPPQEILSAQHIQFISLYRSFGERLRSKIYRTATAILRKLQHPRSQFKIEGWYDKFIMQSVVTNCIDITWYLTPGCLTMEVPYITTVWDLQHRLQPYFSEVCTEGQWDDRENSYAKLLRRATLIVTGTEAGKAEIERFYQVQTERIKVIPLPTPHFALNAPYCDDSEIIKKYNLPGKYLFYPAQFWPHKNHVGLLLAVQLLRDRYDLILPVVFVGSDKGNQSYIRQVVTELDLDNQVYFLGFVSREDLISLYRQALALTFLSFFGPDNLPPLEAFALGCPVVASAVSGAQEQLGNAALLVEPRDEEQIALAIKSLHDDPVLRQKLVQRGLERASMWTIKNYVQSVFSLLDEFEAIRRCWSNREAYHQI